MTRSLLEDAFSHHSWATLQLLDACEPLTPEQLATTVPGTYGSILDTLRHLVGSDTGYLWTITGGEVTMIDKETLDIGGLRAAMQADAAAWLRLLAQDLDPDQVVVRHRDDGSESSAPLGVRLAQAIHHGSDHRSQICTALTVLGVEPPSIDVWDYAWSQGTLRETEPTA